MNKNTGHTTTKRTKSVPFYTFSLSTMQLLFQRAFTLSRPGGEGGGWANRPPLALPMISPNWIKIIRPKLVTFRQIL